MKVKAVYEARPWLKFYPEGCPSEIEIPERSVLEAFDEAANKWGNKTAIIFYGQKISYRELKDQVNRLATALCDLGIKKGDRVALLLLNSPQFIIAFFGALKAGAIVTPISPVYVSPEIKHQLVDSGTETIICQDILWDGVEKAGVALRNVILTNIGEYLPGLKKFLGKSVLRSVYKKMELPSPTIYQREGFYQFQDLLKKYPPNPPKIDFSPKEDVAALPYSGGTTGLPKGVMVTHYNMIAGELLNRAIWSPPLEIGKEILIAFAPFYHIMGLVNLMLAGLLRGWTIVLFTTPDLDEILTACENHRATVFLGAPAVYESLREYEKTDIVDWKRFKLVLCGGDALLEDTAIGWERRTGVQLHQGFGLTETCASGHGSPPGRPKVGPFGVPMPNYKAAVIDPNGTEFLPVGEIGELVYQGPGIMKGYWNQPEETKNAFVEIDGERWFRTGDLVTMDEEGYFTFYDRKRDMIKYKGYSVFAREIEEVLTSHPKIKEAGVIGIPDPKVGENVKAIVVLETEARGKLSEEEITKYCEERLAHYKVPRIIEFRGEIPKTDVGKVSRRELREE